MRPKLQAMLFDLDGTLIDTALDMVREMNLLLTRHGRQPLPYHQLRAVVSDGYKALVDFGFERAQGTSAIPDKEHLYAEYLEAYHTHLSEESRLFDGMDKVLTTLEQHALPWGIVTNKSERFSRQLLIDLALDQRCGCLVGADTCANRKPHPEPMYHACKLLDVSPELCIYVGDAERDVQAGKAAGMQTIAAKYGYIAEGVELNSWQADGVIDTAGELVDILMDGIKK